MRLVIEQEWLIGEFMKNKFIVGIAVVGALLALMVGLPRASAQAAVRRLTGTGDVLEFVWSPQGDVLYVTREGKVVELNGAKQQVAGDLYRVGLDGGAGELLAKRANGTRAPLVGDEIVFTRLKNDGTAQLVVYNPRGNAEREVGAIAFGALPSWNREGGALFFVEDGRMQRMTKAARETVFGRQAFPETARVSALGDRAAFVEEGGLWITQDAETQNVARNDGDAHVLPQFAWSNDGSKVAFVVTHEGFDPEVWITDTTRHTTARVVKGEGLEYFGNVAWSPDDAFLIFTRTPTGSGSAVDGEIWRVRADGGGLRALTRNSGEETLPQYASDGKSIAFLRDGDVWVMELNADGMPQAEANVAQKVPPSYQTERLEMQRTAPATIRVRHDAGNACRNVPVGQIDVIDFETYVKRVVPAEVFSSWDDDALKTQAVAARTYAWFWLLQHGMSAYDVTDSTAYQYMCDTRVGTTDAATDATRGQYLDYLGNMVFAAYGAENGDPTLTNTFGNPYLIGVDDPVSFNKARAGNGIGYSQWGAQRWAAQYDWNYQQILLHYYSDVTVEAAATSGNDTTPPIGAIVSPWKNWGVTSSKLRIVVNASDDHAGVSSIDLKAQYGASNLIIGSLVGSEREFVWDVSALTNQAEIVVMPILHDANGNSSAGASVTFDLDRKKPTGTLGAPAKTTNQTVTLNLNASDAGESNLTGMAFSNDWEWQGENQSRTANSGAVVADADALNGSAVNGSVGTHAAGAWYGPYTNALPTNQAYRAYFRIKTDDVNTTDEIALLDVVTDNGANILGLESVRGTDLQTANVYQEFYVDFFYMGFSTNALEFRTAYRATASLWLDRILVVRAPVAYASSASWTLTAGQGNKRVVGKFVDGAGNVSADAVATVFFGDNPPPTLVPQVWLPMIVNQK